MVRSFSPQSRSLDRSSIGAPNRRRGLVVAVMLAAGLAACGGGGSPAPAASSGVATAAPSGAPASAVPSAGGSAHAGGILSDACSVVTKADVEAAFGGSSTAGTVDENGACAFRISGALKAVGAAAIPARLNVSLNADYSTYAIMKEGLGDTVTKIDGLGSDAWYWMGSLHVQIPGGGLAIIVTLIGSVDSAVRQQNTIDFAKVILARL